MFTQILESIGVKDFEDLTSQEQETLRAWVDKVEKAQITLDDVKKGVGLMREVVEAELVKVETTGRKDLFLKARLKNLILIETILTRPDKARAAFDGYIQGVKVQDK